MLKTLLNIINNNVHEIENFFNRYGVLIIIILAAAGRVWLYGDPKLSIAGNDTMSYVEASQVPLFSSEMMTGRRLLSTNLIYKVLEPEDGYKVTVNGSIDTTRRAVQPGFDRIAILQLVMSVLGWGVLAFVVAGQIKHPLLKSLSALAIVLFAFTPQMADWDSILMSESLTFSLFALQLALLIKLVFSTYQNPSSKNNTLYLAIWAIIFFLWTFLRDTNLFASFVTIGMIATVLFSVRYRKSKYLYGVLVFLVSISIIGLYTSSNSTRSLVQIINIYGDDLLQSPARIETLTELGMPPLGTPEYDAWFQKNSTKALIRFMLIHPGYPATKLIKDVPQSFTEIKQTYFHVPEHAQIREILMSIGDALHPENTTPLLLSSLLTIGLILLAKSNTRETSQPWAWLGIWLFLTAGITLIPTILGDTWALNRHALFSTMIYRLFVWLFSIVVIDIALDQSKRPFPPKISNL